MCGLIHSFRARGSLKAIKLSQIDAIIFATYSKEPCVPHEAEVFKFFGVTKMN
jgi:hypothetical protein